MIKLIISVCLVGFAFPVMADGYDSPYTKMVMVNAKPGDCVESGPLSYQVIKAIDENHYELGAVYDGVVVSHGLLQTSVSKFSRPGRLGGIKVKYLGTKDIPLENGFSASFGIWEECKGGKAFEETPNHRVFN